MASGTMRQGHRGDHVKRWQQFLIEQGHLAEGGADGSFGPKTHEATRSFQAVERIGVDGIAGPMTLGAAAAKGFVVGYAHNPLTVKLAEGLGLPVDILSAFVIVESGTGPNAAQSVRFEPHLAHRSLGPRAEGVIPYTPQSPTKRWSLVRSETNRAALLNAMSRHSDEEWKRAIVESTSFGLFQVLGGALLRLFPQGAEHAVSAFFTDAEVVSHALLGDWFRRSPRALAAAKADPPDIARLCRAYNGPGQTVRYSKALTKALARVRAGV